MFNGKICVVSGGARGIGRRIVEEFARRGSTVAFIDANKDAGKKLAEDVMVRFGVDAFFFHGSVCSEEDLEIFAGAVIGQYGRIDYLINNACICKSGALSGCRCDDFEAVMKVGVAAPYLLAKLFEKYFHEGSAIVNITREDMELPEADAKSRLMAKGAVISLTHALAASFQGAVRVNCVSPGWGGASRDRAAAVPEKESKQLCKRVGEPFDMTRTVIFLCEERADFINGQNITVDGGMTKLFVYHTGNGWKFSI